MNLYDKYIDTLIPARPGTRVLDVGCGVGQVVYRLQEKGIDTYGVDVSESNIEVAKKTNLKCKLYNGTRLPYPDQYFESVGSKNVLEHVEQPEAFIKELIRVTKIGGRVVVSSPNFFRAIGFRDYHPHMRGFYHKYLNFRSVLEKQRQILKNPEIVHFDRMKPIIKRNFSPDDDAIVATNALEIKFFLERFGCQAISVSCTDRYVPKVIDIFLNITPLKYLMFNAFVISNRII